MSAAREVSPEADQDLRELVALARVGLRWVGPDGRILAANQAELDLVGYTAADYVGRHLAEVLVEPGAAADILARVARQEGLASYEARLRTRDGSIRQVLIDGAAHFHEGRFVHSRQATRDISGILERERAARHRAEATSHLKDEFLALLSHELRTPLGAILVWLGLLRQGGFDAPDQERALDIIERSARSLEHIVEDLLHASRIAAGGLMLHPQLIDLRSVVQVAVDTAAGDATLKGLAFSWVHGEAPLWVKGDPGRLQQAFSNLLSNAVKFTPTGGRVEVRLDSVGPQARLRVTDTGEGMTPAFLPLAFERFRQQDTSSTRAHHGLGLGLYVVRHVIGHHGGFVSAESRGPNLGSTFTALLPLATDHPGEAGSSPAPLSTEPEAPTLRGLTVLLVDDEPDVREALRLILEQNGMLVMTAVSAAEAFDLVERLRPDIVLSDIAMPGEDGLSLIRRIRLLPPGSGGLVPAAAISAYASAADRRNALLAGFQQHLAKPVEPAALLGVIARLARKKGVSR
jgi:PAS domain S-box-containing protein